MKYSVDGGKTWNEAPDGVRVLHEGIDGFEDDFGGDVSLLLNHTYEGLITDLMDQDGEVVETDSATVDEIIGHLI